MLIRLGDLNVDRDSYQRDLQSDGKRLTLLNYRAKTPVRMRDSGDVTEEPQP